MPSIFTKIVNGDIPCHKVAETEEFLAFLDINPNAKGHTLAIPKKEVDYLFDLDSGTLAGLMAFSKRVAAALDKTFDCKRVGLLVIGTEVPHAHIHLIPFQKESQMNIVGSKKMEFSQQELAGIAAAIRSNLN
ncbi:MAG TPA: HIT family protein [Bacteroidetes bacterium]|nr:HIT family protein [Bacteroidota bacterium]